MSLARINPQIFSLVAISLLAHVTLSGGRVASGSSLVPLEVIKAKAAMNVEDADLDEVHLRFAPCFRDNFLRVSAHL